MRNSDLLIIVGVIVEISISIVMVLVGIIPATTGGTSVDRHPSENLPQITIPSAKQTPIPGRTPAKNQRQSPNSYPFPFVSPQVPLAPLLLDGHLVGYEDLESGGFIEADSKKPRGWTEEGVPANWPEGNLLARPSWCRIGDWIMHGGPPGLISLAFNGGPACSGPNGTGWLGYWPQLTEDHKAIRAAFAECRTTGPEGKENPVVLGMLLEDGRYKSGDPRTSPATFGIVLNRDGTPNMDYWTGCSRKKTQTS